MENQEIIPCAPVSMGQKDMGQKDRCRHTGGVVVTALTNTRGFDRVRARHFTEGQTLMDMVTSHITPSLFASLEVALVTREKREIIDQPLWTAIVPKAGDFVEISLVPQGGGGKILRTALLIGVVIAATLLAPGIGTALATSTISSGTIAGLAGSLIVGVGFTLINLLIPPKPPTVDREDNPTGGGSINNRLAPGAPVPVMFGDMRFFPPMAAFPITESRGRNRFQTVLLNLGQGPLKIDETDIMIGNQLLENYDGVSLDLREGWQDDTPIEVYTNEVTTNSEVSGRVLEPNVYEIITTETDTDEADVEVLFAAGLVEYSSRGKRQARAVNVEFEYRAVGSGIWLEPEPVLVHQNNPGFQAQRRTDSGEFVNPSAFQLTSSASRISVFRDNTEKPRSFVRRLKFNAPGQYEIRLRRTTPAPAEDDQIQDEVQINQLRSIKNSPPIRAKGMALVALRVRLTDQKAGGLSNVSVRTRRYYPVYENGRWVWPQETRAANGNLNKHLTRNPAAAFYWAAVGPTGKRPVPAAAVDDQSVVDFWNACQAPDLRTGMPRYQFDRIVEGSFRLRDILSEIARAGRARIAAPNGRLAVMRDQVQILPKGVFTPRNLNKLSGNIDFSPHPHGMSVTIVDRDNGYNQSQVVAYAEGFNETNATNIEPLEAPGITERFRAWEFAKYYLKNMEKRAETISFSASVDALHNNIGDYILVKHDVPRPVIGEDGDDFPGGRVTKVTTDVSGSTTSIQIDEFVTFEAGQTYMVAVRRTDPMSLVTFLSVQTVPGETQILTFTQPVPASQPINIGDLIVFGYADRVARDMIITDIRPGADLTVTVTAVDLANDIHDIESVPLPVFPSYATDAENPDIAAPDPVTDLTVTEEFVIDGGVPSVRLSLSWNPATTGSPAARFDIIEVIENGEMHGDVPVMRYRFFGSTEGNEFQLPAEYAKNDTITLAVVSVSTGGTKLPQLMATRLVYTVGLEGDEALLRNDLAGSGNLLFGVDTVEIGETFSVPTSAIEQSFTLFEVGAASARLEESDDVTLSVNISKQASGIATTRALLQFLNGTGSVITTATSEFRDNNLVRVGVSGQIPVGTVTVRGRVSIKGPGSGTVRASKYSLNEGQAVVPYAPPFNPDATAGADSSNLSVGTGVNMLKNSLFIKSIFPWKIRSQSGGAVDIGIAGQDLLVNQSNQFQLVGDAGTATIRHFIFSPQDFCELWYEPGIPVVSGERMEFSIYVLCRRCTGKIVINFFGEDGTSALTVDAAILDSGKINSDFLYKYDRLTVFATAPSNAVLVRPSLIKNQAIGTSNDSELFFTHAYFGRALPNQTEPSMFSPGDVSPFNETDLLPTQVVAGGAGSLDPARPLTAVSFSSNSQINVDLFTILAGDRRIEYNSGSIDNLEQDTGYHVYANDLSFAGGAVSYIATKNRISAIGDGTIYLGYIVTPIPEINQTITSGASSGGGGLIFDPDELLNGSGEIL